MNADEDARLRSGYYWAVAAYCWWGLMPLYFTALAILPPLELLTHRIVWSLPLLIVLIYFTDDFRRIRTIFNRRRTACLMLLSTVLIGLNWYGYIYAVLTKQVIAASLGYFIGPLVSSAMGIFIYREELRRLQWAAYSLAAVGVLILTVAAGGLPWIALCLAFSFSAYGLVRKEANVSGVIGLGIETALLTPLAVGYAVYLLRNGVFILASADGGLTVLILLSGLMTSVPLICFAQAVVRLPLTALALLQYLSPSIQLVIGIFYLKEPFGTLQMVSFVFIWTGLGLFVYDLLQRRPAIKNP